MTDVKPSVVGVGSPIVDLVVEVADEVLKSLPGDKGGMELIDAAAMEKLLEVVGAKSKRSPGGSAANTVSALARLGVPTALLGKLGSDSDGDFYREAFQLLGGHPHRFRKCNINPTGRCVCLVTPDSERTMRTHLGAAMALTPDEIDAQDFEQTTLAHIEGYLLFNPDLMRRVLDSAAESRCKVSLDLGSFEVVRAAGESLGDMLRDDVDIVFANEEEAAAFCGNDDPEEALKALSALCEVAAVKLGADGALIRRGQETLRVPAETVSKPLDTTGAGDLWATGFLYGYLNGYSLETSGKLGAHLGANAVQHFGAALDEQTWSNINRRVGEICEEEKAASN